MRATRFNQSRTTRSHLWRSSALTRGSSPARRNTESSEKKKQVMEGMGWLRRGRNIDVRVQEMPIRLDFLRLSNRWWWILIWKCPSSCLIAIKKKLRRMGNRWTLSRICSRNSGPAWLKSTFRRWDQRRSSSKMPSGVQIQSGKQELRLVKRAHFHWQRLCRPSDPSSQLTATARTRWQQSWAILPMARRSQSSTAAAKSWPVLSSNFFQRNSNFLAEKWI